MRRNKSQRPVELVWIALLVCLMLSVAPKMNPQSRGVSSLSTAPQTAAASEAYFVFDYPPHPETFVFKLTDPAKIQQARELITAGQGKMIDGTIIKQPVYYNPPWSFHLDPKTINFIDGAIELCDSSILGIEVNLDRAWPGWCPWASPLPREISPPPKPGNGNINPTVSMTNPYANDTYRTTAPAQVVLEANADDPDGEIVKVEFFHTNSKIGESRTYPYKIVWDNVPAGVYAVFAVATDSTGATATSKSVTFTVAQRLDDDTFFVQQHYYDFLSRMPDLSGLFFWTGQIAQCGSDGRCTEAMRINVSAAFFLSIEFQQTGYLVERMYKTAFGDGKGASTWNGAHQLDVPMVRFSEFLADTQKIGEGVVVLQPGWEQKLESDKQAFASEFVQRARFLTAFPTSMTPDQFVDKLNLNAGNVLSSSERATTVALFGGAPDTNNSSARAQALRQVAEDQDLYSAEFNRAFVLMQYFGYLRRNPDDAPEATRDYTGYDFWLTKLNQFQGNYIDAEMVKAFITSIEYRGRFAS